MDALPAIVLVFGFGAAIGSFLNVVVYRLPAGLSLLNPPSRCPHCLTPLRAWENVPIVGWLWLRGRCAHCRNPIAKRYPLVEAATAFLFLFAFLRFGFSLQTVGAWVLLGWLLALALIDADTMILPNSLTQTGLLLGLSFQFARGLVPDFSWTEGIRQLVATGLLAAVLGIWLFDVLSFAGSIAFGKTAMGGGDAKLAAMMGAWLGWKLMLLAGFLAAAAGAFLGGGAIALGWLDRRQPFPFGPFLALGAAIALFWGDGMLAAYQNIFFPAL